LVRFLRNVTVAKIAGNDSALLQISSDERARVGRVAVLFTEEDLARHLQIMLRTHGELGYRQEQRFHLELGLLKMAHAQRLLPLEQILSEVTADASGPARTAPRPIPAAPARASAMSSELRRPEPASARSNSVSPFAADSARKNTPRSESSTAVCGADSPVREPSGLANVVIMESAAPAMEEISAEGLPPTLETKLPTELDSLRVAVLNALNDRPMLASLLGNAEWRLEGTALIAKVAASAALIEMSFTAESRRVASAAASGQAGKPIKMHLEADRSTQPAPVSRGASNGSARSRAERDPIVQRMKEKFGAEIRTVIDYRERR